MTNLTHPWPSCPGSLATEEKPEPVPFSERARVVRRVARQRAISGMNRIREAANAHLTELARHHEAELERTRAKVRAGMRRTYAWTGMSAMFSAVLVGAAVSATQPKLIDDALLDLSAALPEPDVDLTAWTAPSRVHAEGQRVEEPSNPDARVGSSKQTPSAAPARSVSSAAAKNVATKKAVPKNAEQPPAASSPFTCGGDEYDPLNSCLL